MNKELYTQCKFVKLTRKLMEANPSGDGSEYLLKIIRGNNLGDFSAVDIYPDYIIDKDKTIDKSLFLSGLRWQLLSLYNKGYLNLKAPDVYSLKQRD